MVRLKLNSSSLLVTVKFLKNKQYVYIHDKPFPCDLDIIKFKGISKPLQQFVKSFIKGVIYSQMSLILSY